MEVRKPFSDMTEQELKICEVKALEKIGRNLEALTIWFEDIDKEEWSNRIQWYLDMLKRAYFDTKLENSNV